jgi:hypothetical protein
MEVNFNNLRKQACIAYDGLCQQLNSAIDEDGDIQISASEIQGCMDDLRMTIGSIAFCYEEGNPDMIDVWSDFYGEDGSMESFNPNAEE